jgi:dephospho-CoA kinase
MRSPPLRIALTGGIGTGKSHCLERFARLGIPVIDADVLAREALAPSTPELSAVVARFGRAVLDAAGALDRPALARLVFADPTARRDLEAIVHPAVYRQIADWFESLAGAGGSARTPALGIADIPLLYETGREVDFDRVIVATCPPAQQVERLVARGWSEEDARQRMSAQWPIEEKVRRADYVIDTSGTPDATDRQVLEVSARLQ